MKKFFLLFFSMFILSSLSYVQAQEVDSTKYPDYKELNNPDWSLMKYKKVSYNAKGEAETLPSHVNNAETLYWPGIVSQSGGSCGSASRICYMFNYEVNCERGADGSLNVNKYPSHFTWLLTYHGSGKEGMAETTGVPNMVTYGGRTYSSLFGAQTWENDNFGWMQGYDKWFEAMNNRIYYASNFPIALNEEEGRLALKHWIWNHNGDHDFHAGGIAGIGVASACQRLQIPNTAANQEANVVGMQYVGKWGDQVDHALTIVGYDDRIEFDLDGDGNIGEVNEDEVGAWIIANSWGSWANNGFIYCPYKYSCKIRQSEGSYWKAEVYHARKNYRPIRTIKIKMNYSHRSELLLKAGISEDINATEPEETTSFDHFKNAGDHDKNDDITPGNPMLGKWKDGVHYEAMEFGYDLTDLSANFDTRKPLKYFFIIETKSGADGEGKIDNCSILDYEFDKNGVEFPFDVKDLSIENDGKRTMVSVVVEGERIVKPTNIDMSENGVLSWQKPATNFEVTKYYIYKDNVLCDSVKGTTLSYNTDKTPAVYYVRALFENGENPLLSPASDHARINTEAVTINSYKGYKFEESGFTLHDLFKTHYDQATIEFWMLPTKNRLIDMQMGPGWGLFRINIDNKGTLRAGWDNSGRGSVSYSNVLPGGSWDHVAIVIDKGRLTLFFNGNQVSTILSGRTGIGGFGDFVVGTEDYPINGSIEEFRVWNTARTAEEIKASYKSPLLNAYSNPNLIAYLPMQAIEVNGETMLLEAAYGNHATLATYGTAKSNFSLAANTKPTLSADFNLEGSAPFYAKRPINVKNLSSTNAVRYEWTAAGAGADKLSTESPTFTFNGTGSQTIELTAYDADGNSKTISKTIDLVAEEKPVAQFELIGTEFAAGTAIPLVNKTEMLGCSYQWSMPGADNETINTKNATAYYQGHGNYTITLTATNSAGSSSASKTINITPVAPEADFKVTPEFIYLGETTYLNNMSKFAPTNSEWFLKSGNHTMVVNGLNSSLTPTQPGIYDVTLNVKNARGTDTNTQNKALTVLNANSGNGLNFDGENDQLVLPNICKDGTEAFTISWWMHPNSEKDAYFGIGDEKGTMQIQASGTKLSLIMNNRSGSTYSQYIIIGEWHHYAVSFSDGYVYFYRDGELQRESRHSASTVPAMSKFVLGGTEFPINAHIDEFAIWNKLLTADEIKERCNQPLANIAEEETNNNLVVYYQFNQNSGDVMDATSNHFDGVRQNFGPDGDAWSSSLGVFSLNLSQSAEDVTANYLTNCSLPFKHTENFVNGTSRFYELETGTADSGWKIENAAVNEGITTGPHVDESKDKALTVTTEWDGFATQVNNNKLYQTITLPAGVYRLDVESFNEFIVENSVIAVAKGTTLPDLSDATIDAIGCTPLENKTLTFALNEETEVSLGFIFNLTSRACLTIKNITLTKLSSEIIEGDGLTDIETIQTDNKSGQNICIAPIKGGVSISATHPTSVTIYNINGIKITEKTIAELTNILLKKGVYIINHQKVVVQ